MLNIKIYDIGLVIMGEAPGPGFATSLSSLQWVNF